MHAAAASRPSLDSLPPLCPVLLLAGWGFLDAIKDRTLTQVCSGQRPHHGGGDAIHVYENFIAAAAISNLLYLHTTPGLPDWPLLWLNLSH